MDRLQEANKVATLMRRRENLKSLVPAQSESFASLLRRGFYQSLPWAAPPAPAENMPSIRPVLEARVQRGGSFFSPEALRPKGKQAPRSSGYQRGAGKANEPMLREPREYKMQVTLPRSQSARVWDGARAMKARRRGFPLARHRSTRPIVSSESRREPLGGATYQRVAAPPLALELPAREGQPVRAAGSQPMLPPARMLRGLAYVQGKSQLQWPGAVASTLEIQEGPTPRSRTPLIVPLVRTVATPHGPGHGLLPGMTRGSALRVGQISRDSQMAQRSAPIDWTGADLPTVVLARGHAVNASLRSAAWNRGGTRAVQVTPKVADLIPRFSTVSFEPQEAPFGYSTFEIQSGMPALPVSQASPAPKTAQARAEAKAAEVIRLEDRFDAGLGNWVGGVSDWKVDVAGVRPGALALFAPSLAMIDYDFEFLARIDQKSLSWVFRSADERDYHLATIANSPQGRTFTRSSVIDGAPGLSVTTPVRQVANPKAAVTIHTRVRGNDFTVSIDGETIERWSDNRLAIGGVGFLGEPDNRARLYWMRLVTGASDR
jgi:hypothetical protein